MRRYRKGDTFRPPSAAESAASADALEGHRRRPPVSQVRLGRGDKILVKTHVDGIPARDGVTIYSAICTKLVETSAAEEKTILETDEEIEVFNLETTAVLGGIYVQTGLTLHGTRFVESAVLLREFELKDNLTKGGTAVAHTRNRAGGVWVTDVAAGAEFTVKDMHSEYIGRGKDDYGSPHDAGSFGRARLVKDTWEILHLTPHATHIQGLVNMGSGLLTTDSDITVDGAGGAVKICTTGGILVRGPVTSIPNTYADAADDDAPFDAFWDDSIGSDGGWRCIAIKCPA